MRTRRPTPWLGSAEFRGIRAADPVEHVDIATGGDRLAAGGFWVVVATFEGRLDAWRFAHVERAAPPAAQMPSGRPWNGPARDRWRSSLSVDEYCDGVEAIRRDVREGTVYQVNLCRTLTAPMPSLRPGPDAVALSERLARGNPAHHAARIVIGDSERAPGVWIVSASPELFLSVSGSTIRSSPIKGTAAPGDPMLPKDEAENVMITDLIRNDLSHVAVAGTVSVPEFLSLHELPGLVHLQSTVSATLLPELAWTPQMWPDVLSATFPPGSVSGAPKSSALDIIRRRESEARGPYCGGIGWIDADSRTAELAVGIRTFWWTPDDGGTLHFGTGAGITWGSDPRGEWRETELKAQRLIGLASADTISP